jgi:striatin 1/3/4
MELPDANDLPESQGENGEEPEQQLLTAIYRPDSKAAWREELRAANEKAEKVC